MSRRDDLEDQALKLIIDKGTDGILQSTMWRELKASSREGSRICLRLEAKNLIKRERELSKGRWTYRIFFKKRLIAIDSLLKIPCMFCDYIYRCEQDGEISPTNCVPLTLWLFAFEDNPESS
ncbi:MAG: transcriptional regulator [Candidatus Bathyarchaeia archaeon]